MTRRSSLVGFFFCAYTFSWLCWFSVAAAAAGYIALPVPKQPLTTLGQFGPFVAALLLTAVQTGKPGLRALGRSLLRWKVHPVWFGMALGLPPASFLAAIGAHSLCQGVPPEFRPVRIVYDVFLNFFIMLFLGGPLGEELGWRGFALPRLQASHSPVTASIVLAVGWAGWHLPLWLLDGAFTVSAFSLYLVGTIPLTVLFTWLYQGTRGSVLLAMLFHGSINTWYIVLPVERAFPAWVLLLWMLALLIILTKQGCWFSRKRYTEPGSKPITFGSHFQGVAYTERPAAYAVVAGENGTVGAVRGKAGMFFLPGGGSLPGETAEETLVREVREELARSVRLVGKIGEATQFFYAADDDCHYKMLGVFHLAEFPDEPSGQGEHELFWLPLEKVAGAFFHESHAWAARQGLQRSTEGPRA